MTNVVLKAGLLASAALMASKPAYAQAADELENPSDIIVTARRVEERLQEVPISITVFSQQELTRNNIAVATDLATYTPSLSVNQRYGPEKASFAIRGFNQDQGTAPTVGIYFADVIGPRAQGGTTVGNTVGAGVFLDLENVQVLKGPQGTLFGRNTTGGAVMLVPKKPTDRLEGFVEGTYGNYDQVRLQGAINIPLSETFKIRLSAERNSRDGYMRNVSGRGPRDYNDVDYTYGRLSIVANLTPDLENYTIFHFSDSRGNGYGTRITGCASPTSTVSPLIVTLGAPGYSGTRHLQAASCADQLRRQTGRGDSLYEIESSNLDPFITIQQWQAINTTTWTVSDTITVKNIASYGVFRERDNFDLGSSNFAVPLVDSGTTVTGAPAVGFAARRLSPQLPNVVVPGGTRYDRVILDVFGPNSYSAEQSTLTEEFQIQGNSADGKLNFVVGGYLEFSRPLGYSDSRTNSFLACASASALTCSNPLLIGSIAETATQLSFDNHGIFAQGTYRFTDQFAITAGARYTFDKVTGFSDSTRLRLDPTGTNPSSFIDPATGARATRTCRDTFRHPTVIPQSDRSVCRTSLANKSDKPTWVIDLDYKPTPDVLLYAKYARGYRQGGLSFTNPGLETWGPETLDSYEIGAKTSFRGGVTGYFNVAGFYNDLRGAQFFAGLVPTNAAAAAGNVGGAGIFNAGSAEIYGLEIDAAITLFESLRLSAGYTYLHTNVTNAPPRATVGDGSLLGQKLIGTPYGIVTPQIVEGSVLPYSPEHKLTLTGSYTLPLDSRIGEVSIAATWAHQSSYVNDGSAPASVNGIALGVTPSTNLINVNLDWRRVAGSPIDLSLFVTNLTKERFTVSSTSAWTTAGIAEITLNQPRFYGVRLRYNFGS